MSNSKPKRDRSPSFPIVPLKLALKRVEAFDETFGRHPAPASKVGLAWGMTEGSSQAGQVLAALKAFGLVAYSGIAKDRTASLTDDARTYLRAQQDSIKWEVVRRIATKPQQIQKFWSVWGADRPPDPVCLDDLILKHSFTESAANTFLKVYDETITFAGLSNGDTINHDGEEDGVTTDFSIGDYVNWECNGQIQWGKSRKIVAVDQHETGDLFYKVEGVTEDETGWIPVEQAIERSDPLVADPNLFAPPKGKPHGNQGHDSESDDHLADGDRLLARGLLGKDSGFKLIVHGSIGPREIDRLISKLELDRDILAELSDDD